MRQDPKKELRRLVKTKIAALSTIERKVRSERIWSFFSRQTEYLNAKSVLFFCGLQDEIVTGEMLEAILADGKRLALPRCNPDDNVLELKWVKNLEEDLLPGMLNIMEPKEELPTASVNEIQLAVIPGRAFDLRGNRLGRGKGYYDRLLANAKWKAIKCSLVFDVQIVNTVPTNEHDRPVDIIITETGIIHCPHYKS